MTKDVKKKSKKQEDRTAKDFGGKVTPASGALDSAKGDVKTPFFLIENKYTDKDFYKLELKTWKKIEKEAIKDSLRYPVLQVDIQDISIVVMNWWDLKSFMPAEFLPMGGVNTSNKQVILLKADFYGLHYGDYREIRFQGEKDLLVVRLEDFKRFLNCGIDNLML
jgi:hypothetical protein